ncbi:tRNA 4-thiouridine(8) synthase ThiI [Thermodesulfobacteriota bacterium]
MNQDLKKVRALGLLSGGLDSILSGVVLRDQGIAVEWISFETPFFSAENARQAAARLGIRLTVENITPVYIEMLKDPPCGYGQAMNPCLDCHALMFKMAGKTLVAEGFDFLFSGEVLGQRPMSQTRSSLRYVEKRSGFDGHILRPLSARLLAETIPEKKGLVNREKLYDISGRSRKPQMMLVKKFGITEYPAPAGGCLLTDKNFSARLKDLLNYQDTHSEEDFYLLQYGRHIRLGDTTKIIVGRTKSDNENIAGFYDPAKHTIIRVKKIPGPITLMIPDVNLASIKLAAQICVRYSKAPQDRPVEVEVVRPQGRETIKVFALPPEKIRHLLI